MPLFFVKDQPLPLELKAANIIEPRYKALIKEHDTLGLVYSDQRGLVRVGTIVKIIRRVENFRGMNATRVLMQATGTFTLSGFDQAPDSANQVYAIARVHSLEDGDWLAQQSLEPDADTRLQSERIIAKARKASDFSRTLYTSASLPEDYLRAERGILLAWLQTGSQKINCPWSVVWHAARLLTWTPAAKHRLMQQKQVRERLTVIEGRLDDILRRYEISATRRTLRARVVKKVRQLASRTQFHPRDVIERAAPAVVTVTSGPIANSKGSGVHIGEGRLVTSGHVVDHVAEGGQVQVALHDGRVLQVDFALALKP